MIDVTKSLADELIGFFGERIKVTEPETGMVSIQVPVDQWFDVAQSLRDVTKEYNAATKAAREFNKAQGETGDAVGDDPGGGI